MSLVSMYFDKHRYDIDVTYTLVNGHWQFEARCRQCPTTCVTWWA